MLRTSFRRHVSAVAVGALLATSGAVVGATPPAFGAPPANDSLANAREIADIPTRIVQATRGASSSPDDGECVGGGSVWYRYRPTTTRVGRVVTVGSDFDTLLAVFRGPPDNRSLVACSDDAMGLASAAEVRFVAGARYWIAVSACCDPEAVGGRSVLTLYRPRPAAVTVTLDADSVETGAVSGRLFASGTVRCATPSLARVSVTASQRVGTSVARGARSTTLPVCNRRARPWTVQMDSETAIAFQEGLASVALRGQTNDGFVFATTRLPATNVLVGSNPNRAARLADRSKRWARSGPWRLGGRRTPRRRDGVRSG